MALPLNIYTTKFSTTLDPVEQVIYTSPVGYNSIPLAIAACNTSVSLKTVSLELANPADERVSLIKDFQIPGNDTADLSVGKIVVPSGWSIYATSPDNTTHLTISLLETKI